MVMIFWNEHEACLTKEEYSLPMFEENICSWAAAATVGLLS